MKHYVYGSGMAGCLYDNGPHFSETRDDAVEALISTFAEELSDDEAGRLTRNLYDAGLHYFDDPTAVGAHYCEVREQEGPCPETDD